MRNMLLIILLSFSVTQLFSQDTIHLNKESYIITGEKKVVLDSLIVINEKLENRIQKFIKKERVNKKQFVLIYFSSYENISRDSVVFELWMISDDYRREIETYENDSLAYTSFDSTIVLIPYFLGDRNSLFFRISERNKTIKLETREYIQRRGGGSGEKSHLAAYVFYMNKHGKLKCKNAKRVFPIVYKDYSWFRTNIIYRKQAKRHGLID